MVIGIDIQEGAEVVVKNDRLYLIFDEKETKRDLWKMSVGVWLSEGSSVSEFYKSSLLSTKNLMLSNKNTLNFG